MTELNNLIRSADDDGFVVVRNFFDPAIVEKARQELDPYFNAGGLENLLWPSQTLHMSVPGKSSALDSLFERIFSDPKSLGLLQAVGGKNFKARDINARRATGVADSGDQFHHALEWHRDARPEFGVGIILADIDKGGPATGFVRGSHKWFSDPRWDVLLGAPFFPKRTTRGPWKEGLKFLTRFNPFTRMLWKREIAPRVTAAYGKQGDFYVFINQTWHNRMSNAIGSKGVVVLASLFPTEEEFSVGAVPWPAETVAKVPPAFGRILEGKLPPNTPSDTLLARMFVARKKPPLFCLFGMARTERLLMNYVSRIFQTVTDPIKGIVFHSARSAYRLLRRVARWFIPPGLRASLRGGNNRPNRHPATRP